MGESVKYLFKFFCYYLSSRHRKGYGIHSPFLYEFIINVMNGKIENNDIRIIRNLRKELRSVQTRIKVRDYGAGSNNGTTKNVSISRITRGSSVPDKYGLLLYKIGKYFKPRVVVELGTSLGISTLYLALSNKDAEVHTIEGSQKLSKIARDNFKKSNVHSIQQYRGRFNYVLPGITRKLNNIDLLFIDGDHKEGATLKYFERCLEIMNKNSVVVLDDIHWSSGMERAWERIKEKPEVKLTIDIFRFGIVFFREDLHTKQHFRVRY